jgi:hypothetical protein
VNRYIRVAFGLLVVIWVADLVSQIFDITRFWMDDALSYAAGGRHLLAAQPIYAPFQLAGPYGLGDAAWGHGFVYPPTAALLFVPLAPLGMSGLGVVFVAALMALVFLAYGVARSTGLDTRTAAILATLVTFSGPAINASSSGNFNLLIADALLASWLRPRWSGYLAVVGGLVKFFPAAGLVWTLRTRGPFLRPITVGLFIAAITTLIVASAGWRDFLVAFANGHSSSWYEIPSPAQALGPGIGTAVGYGLAALALGGVWRIRDDRLAFAMLGWAMILPAPDWWSHYLVVPLAAGLPWVCAEIRPRVVRRTSQSRATVGHPSHERNTATSSRKMSAPSAESKQASGRFSRLRKPFER